jgi:CheY-like chemotaxis protein
MGADSVPTVLLVEDNEIDVESIRRAFRKASIDLPLVHATDGINALAYLESQKKEKLERSKLVILLDINMPKMNGIEFLEQLRLNPKTKALPVFILTTSDHIKDKQEAYALNVAGYFIKSGSSDEFNKLIEMLCDYWQSLAFPIDIIGSR